MLTNQQPQPAQAAFELFMLAQMQAITDSGLDPEVWIDEHAQAFRANWDAQQQED